MSCGCNQPDPTLPRAIYQGEAYRVIQVTRNGTRRLWAWSNLKDGGQKALECSQHKDTAKVLVEDESQYVRRNNP